MAQTIHLEVVTPTGLAVRAEADQVECPSVLGEFGVLPGHLPLLAALRAGVVHYRSAGKILVVAVGQGFVEAGADHMSLLTDAAVMGPDVDVASAKAERDEFQKKIDTYTGEAVGAEYEELVRKRDWALAQLEAAKESGKSI